jgi:hypothetical protein
MERSDIREPPIPDVAALHPGYKLQAGRVVKRLSRLRALMLEEISSI